MDTETKKSNIPVWCLILVAFLILIIVVLFCILSFFIGKEFSASKQGYNITADQNNQSISSKLSQQRAISQTVEQEYTSGQPLEQEPPTVQGTTSIGQSKNITADRDKVINYFEQMDLIAMEGRKFEDPNAYANEMVKGIASGDFSSLNSLISTLDGIINKAERLSAPKDCLEHKKASIDVLKNGREMLASIRKSIEQQDISALEAIQAKGEKAKLSAEQVSVLEKNIKAKYGIN